MSLLPRSVGSLSLVVLLVTAGCVGVLTGEQPLEVSSEPVSVSGDAASAARYEEVRTEPVEMTREFSAAGQTRAVRVTNHLAEYARTVDVGPAGSGELARFVAFSTPKVELLGRTFNPIGEMSNEELVELVQGRYEGVSNVAPVGERSRPLLGTSTAVSTFTADAELGGSGQSVELLFHVARVEHEGDFVVVIAVHPAALDGEAGRVDAMIGGVVHPAG